MAVNFNGTSQKLQIGGSVAPYAQFWAGGATLVWWWRNYDTNGYVYSKEGRHQLRFLGSGAFRFDLYWSGASSWYWPAPDTSGELHMYALVYNEDSASNVPTLYLDGVPQSRSGSGPSGSAITDTDRNMVWGNRTFGSDTGQNADFMNLMMYPRELTQDEVRLLYYSQGRARVPGARSLVPLQDAPAGGTVTAVDQGGYGGPDFAPNASPTQVEHAVRRPFAA